MHSHASTAVQSINIYGKQFPLPVDQHNVRLSKGAVLRQRSEAPRYAHILQSGLISTAISLEDGRSMAVRTQSAGSLLELDCLLGCSSRECTSTVLMPGVALRIPFADVQAAFQQDRDMQRNLSHALGLRALELEQISVCNRIHPLEQRLARHLLLLWCMTKSASLPLTQEDLAHELGVQRSTVVCAAGVLRQKGLIHFRRGSISISDPEGLERAACECYPFLRALKEGKTTPKAAAAATAS